MHKKIMIVSLSALLIGCSAKSSTVQSSAITGGTVGVLAGAVMGATVAFASGETGSKLATKAVVFGILVGLAGASIGSSVAFTKEIFGGDKEESEANQKINHAIEKSNKREEKIKIYNKDEIVDVTDSIARTENMENNETNNTIKVNHNDAQDDLNNQVYTIEDEPISVSTDTNTTILKESYSKEIE